MGLLLHAMTVSSPGPARLRSTRRGNPESNTICKTQTKGCVRETWKDLCNLRGCRERGLQSVTAIKNKDSNPCVLPKTVLFRALTPRAI